MTISQADFDALKAEVVQLRKEMGAVPDFQRDGYLDNPVHTRMHEIGLAIDADVAAVGSFEGRLEAVESRPASTSGSTVDIDSVLAALATFRIHIAKDPETNREYLGIGMVPKFDDWSPIQIGGGLSGQISAYGSTEHVDGTGAGSPNSASSVVILDGDGGLGFRQYGIFGKRGFIRNTLGRPFSVIRFDSTGDLCSSRVPVGETSDGGQSWYIVTDYATKVIRFVTYKLGWKIRMVESVAEYGAADKIVGGE